VFEIDGVDANKKEMDIHTELPWGDRAIFEVFTNRAQSEKSVQLEQYAELLEIAEGVQAEQIMLTDQSRTGLTVDRDLLCELLDSDIQTPRDVECPFELPNRNGWEDVEYLGEADSLSYDGFEPDFEPIDPSQSAENEIIELLQEFGYDPTLPVYCDGMHYGFCGPTIEIGGGKTNANITFYSKRESPWVESTLGHKRNDRMVGASSTGRGYEWMIVGPGQWHYCLGGIKENPVVVVEVTDTTQSKLTASLFDSLLRE
jgi:hypothetical protein